MENLGNADEIVAWALPTDILFQQYAVGGFFSIQASHYGGVRHKMSVFKNQCKFLQLQKEKRGM